MIKAIIFDLDGVIIESAGIKTEAFRELFKEYPKELPEIMAYHQKNAGVSRYIKFRYFYKNILKKELTPEKEKKLGEQFSQIALEKILKAPLVKGVKTFLNNNYRSLQLYIASGTPEEELKYILKKRGLDTYFKGVYGTPASKTEITRRILSEYRLKLNEVIFVGDAESDRTAAKETGVFFVARMGEESASLEDSAYKIRDFREFDTMLKNISNISPEK